MIVRCLGGWKDGVDHLPVIICEKEPLADTRPSDTICDRCTVAMNTPIICRGCKKAETETGLCEPCVTRLEAHVGAPKYFLTVFRAGALPVVGHFDGAGVVLRLKMMAKNTNYCGFELKTRPTDL